MVSSRRLIRMMKEKRAAVKVPLSVMSTAIALVAVVALVGAFRGSPATHRAATGGSGSAGTCSAGLCQTADSAEASRRANFPPAQPIASNATWVSRSDVIAAARRQARDATGFGSLSATLQAQLPTTAKLMTVRELNAKEEQLISDPLIAPDRPIWVVTVHGHMPIDPLPGHKAMIVDVYTDVYDAPTGSLIMRAIGLDVLG